MVFIHDMSAVYLMYDLSIYYSHNGNPSHDHSKIISTIIIVP